MSKSRPKLPPPPRGPQPAAPEGVYGFFASRGVRETIESLAVAIILALLFRGFEAEAFVIPTGSMAPALMGRHVDVQCPQCQYWYQAGASEENGDSGRLPGFVVAATCPMCRYNQTLDRTSGQGDGGVRAGNPNHESFTGDRILVSKFAYDLAEPQRWDVIVFKYPWNAKQNYIKRLVGLPGETLRIRHGDVFVSRGGENGKFSIARKPPHKLRAMLQLVDDTDHVGAQLQAAGWPARWQPWAPAGADAAGDWRERSTTAAPAGESWLRYRHLIPSASDWEQIENEEPVTGLAERQGQLITDFYAYNAAHKVGSLQPSYYRGPDDLFDGPDSPDLGLHWVPDIAVETDVEVRSDAGELLLDLVRAGVHHVCRIDLATGRAVLERDGGRRPFVNAEGVSTLAPAAETAVRGPGKYRLLFSNVDHELRLWVNDRLVTFDGPTTFEPAADEERPVWTPTDPFDQAPAGVGVRGAEAAFPRLKIWRDVYYIASPPSGGHEYNPGPADGVAGILAILRDPTQWAQTPLFAQRRQRTYQLGADQFFPMGDNSPQSMDARVWNGPHYVERRLLIGKALFIYWPHHWPRPVPFTPNVGRMRLIH